jgi:formylglycine-generating enzyme required for sulfatase activity/serine/threonine protein kinase
MEQIGKYKVLAHIGHGAMGSVEKAEAPDGTIVAIKTLFPQFVFEEEYVKRFKREAELAKKLSHPNVVKILEVGEDQEGRRQYIVMEYIDGKTLAECMHDKGMASIAIKRSSKLNEKDKADSKKKKASKKSPAVTTFSAKETIKIIRQLAGVLQAANDISLLHRDVKPQNILLDKKGNAKLLDFGLAKDTEALVSMLSMTGQSIGTPPYMSPEQHDGQKDIDIRSDLYSLGCTAYHMLTGKAPFPGPTASAFARQHCDDIPTPVHTINKDCPLNLSQLIDRLLAKKSAKRHHNPAELIEDLNRVERGEVPLKLYKPKKSKKHNPVRNWLTVAAAVIIVAACFYGWDSYRRNNAKTIIAETLSDARELAVEHKFKQAKNVLDDIISEYAESNPEQVKKAESLRTKLIEQHGKWIAGETARGRQEQGVELTRAEVVRKRKLHNCLRNAARLKKHENHVKKAAALIEKAYQLCNTDAERARVAIVGGKVQEALAKMRPWAAVADFTLDKSVEAKLTGSAVAVKLEQALGQKYRLVTRNQVKKALRELRFQSSDLADKSKAKQFGKLVGAEYLISGSVIQLGREITVACQIFNIETGAIRQTAEVSASNVNDFNYMIRDAAKILGMSNVEKIKYVEKLNSSKQTSGGKYPQISQDNPSNEKDRIIPNLGMKLVYVAPGSFIMGSNDGQKDEKPMHKVTIINGYWIGKHEVTQNEYQSIMISNPSNFKGSNKPVEQVSWNEAVKFCKKLTASERAAGRLPSGCEYRLPTEAEWEFAARGGTKSRGYKYSGSDSIDSVAWYGSNSDKKTHEIGTKSGNELGIYDMSGNVWEWCNDWHGKYSSSGATDPRGASSGSGRVSRGGSWYDNSAGHCRSADRNGDGPSYRDFRIGFRIVLAPCIVDNKIKAPPAPKTKTLVAPRKRAGITPVKKDLSKIIPGLGIKFVHVEPGSFLMGMNGEASSMPLRKVNVNKAYWIGKCELTQREYQSIMGNNPSRFKGDNRPVEQVSWNDALKFCQKLTEQEKKAGRLPSGYEYRLPTEAEWEYAARGGNKSKGYAYSGSNDHRAVAWNKYTAKRKTHDVGTKPANELGIHDMSGNVYEWCLDNWHKDYNKAPSDASAWIDNSNPSRVYRSGGLFSPARWCKVGHRSNNFPYAKFNRLGFRVALAPVIAVKTSKPKVLDKIIPDLGMKLIYIAPGTFEMGSNNSRSFEKPMHEVSIYKAYWIGKYEVTQNEYQTITGTNPSHFKGSNKPVEKVNWHDALNFCKKLTERERKAGRLPSGYTYQLPTEAEWEYAARGGNKSKDYKYSGSNSLSETAWYASNSDKKTHEVGTKTANELGIHDMSGNVWEWCRDDWHGNYKNAPSDADSWGKGTTQLRVRRGGSWRGSAKYRRITLRSYSPPTRMYNYLGFRVVLRSYFKNSKNPKKISFPKSNIAKSSTKTIIPQIKTSPRIEKKVYKKVSEAEHQENIKNEKSKARKRMYADIKKYSQKESQEIESLYQSMYKLRDPEKTYKLERLIAKYPKANRTGCALLYLAYRQKGDAQRHALLKVIKKYGDCYYGDGTNVGADAKYFLARYYLSHKKMKKLKLLLDDLRENHRAAIHHNKQNLASLVGEMLD